MGALTTEAGGKRFGLDSIVPPEDSSLDGAAEATQTRMYAPPAPTDPTSIQARKYMCYRISHAVHWFLPTFPWRAPLHEWKQ